MSKFFGKLSAALISLTVLSLAEVAVAADEKQQFEKPSFSKGDYWVYSTPNGEERLEYVGEEDGYHVFMAKGAKQLRDASLNGKGDDHRYYQFPLSVGKYWSFEYQTRASGSAQAMVRATCEVKGIEPVETAAGRFQALNITCDEAFSHVNGRRIRTYSYWYAPEVKQMVKNTGNKVLKEYKIQK